MASPIKFAFYWKMSNGWKFTEIVTGHPKLCLIGQFSTQKSNIRTLMYLPFVVMKWGWMTPSSPRVWFWFSGSRMEHSKPIIINKNLPLYHKEISRKILPKTQHFLGKLDMSKTLILDPKGHISEVSDSL